MLIRQALPEEGEELFDFYYAAIIALSNTFPTLPAFAGSSKAKAYLRELRLQRIVAPDVYSVLAFEAADQEDGKRGKIIGFMEFGPPSGYSPLGEICPWEILCLYTSGRGKGIARPMIKYALEVAVREGKLAKPPSERQQNGGNEGGQGTITSDQASAQAVLGVISHCDNAGGQAFYAKIGGKRTPDVYDVMVSVRKRSIAHCPCIRALI